MTCFTLDTARKGSCPAFVFGYQVVHKNSLKSSAGNNITQSQGRTTHDPPNQKYFRLLSLFHSGNFQEPTQTELSVFQFRFGKRGLKRQLIVKRIVFKTPIHPTTGAINWQAVFVLYQVATRQVSLFRTSINTCIWGVLTVCFCVAHDPIRDRREQKKLQRLTSTSCHDRRNTYVNLHPLSAQEDSDSDWKSHSLRCHTCGNLKDLAASITRKVRWTGRNEQCICTGKEVRFDTTPTTPTGLQGKFTPKLAAKFNMRCQRKRNPNEVVFLRCLLGAH